ncbi:hypothetical protein Ddye_024236, partial [Dipteronia dyeriana]
MACASQLDSMRSPSSPLHRVKLSVISHVRLTDSVIVQLKRHGFKELNRIFKLSIH